MRQTSLFKNHDHAQTQRNQTGAKTSIQVWSCPCEVGVIKCGQDLEPPIHWPHFCKYHRLVAVSAIPSTIFALQVLGNRVLGYYVSWPFCKFGSASGPFRLGRKIGMGGERLEPLCCIVLWAESLGIMVFGQRPSGDHRIRFWLNVPNSRALNFPAINQLPPSS